MIGHRRLRRAAGIAGPAVAATQGSDDVHPSMSPRRVDDAVAQAFTSLVGRAVVRF
jgi:hypothetical protein